MGSLVGGCSGNSFITSQGLPLSVVVVSTQPPWIAAVLPAVRRTQHMKHDNVVHTIHLLSQSLLCPS